MSRQHEQREQYRQYEKLNKHLTKIKDKVDLKYVSTRLEYILNRILSKDEYMAQHEINRLWHYFINRDIPSDMK